jgi:hypothetical protein
LTRAAEQELTEWMLAHLEVAVHPFAKATRSATSSAACSLCSILR